MRIADSAARFKGEVRRENAAVRDRRIRQNAKQLDHPLVTVAVVAVVWGILMWFAGGRPSDAVALVALAVTSVSLGALWLLYTRVTQRRMQRRQARASAR
jgi:hypothetical protein